MFRALVLIYFWLSSSFAFSQYFDQDSCFIYIPNVVGADCGNYQNDYMFEVYTDCEHYVVKLYNQIGGLIFVSSLNNTRYSMRDYPDGLYRCEIYDTRGARLLYVAEQHIIIL